MKQESWTKRKLVNRLIKIYQEGKELKADIIKKTNSSVYNALYYKSPNGKRKYFSSLSAAREEVATNLEERGDPKGAEKVRRLNLPKESYRKYTPKEVEKIKKDTLEEFQRKIDADSDVSLRHLRETEGTFTYRLEKYIGYREAFKILGLNPNDYAKNTKRRPEHYLGKIIRRIRQSKTLEAKVVERENPGIMRKLSSHYGGYYNALEKSKEWLEKKGRLDLAQKADPKKLKRDLAIKREENRISKKKNSKAKITALDSKSYYSPSQIKRIEIDAQLSGKEIKEKLIKSGKWISTTQAAKETKTTPDNIRKVFPLNYPEASIKIKEGKRSVYLFNKKTIKEYTRKNKKDSLPKDSINHLAKTLNIGNSKIRNIVENLSLGTTKQTHRSISKEEQALIEKILLRENHIKEALESEINPRKNYTLVELETLGFPVSYFRKEIRHQRLKPELKKGRHAISGSQALEYLKTKYNTSYFSQTLKIISSLHPHIYTTSDLMQRTGIDRSKMKKYLDTLLKENPNACFRIRKSEERSRVIATEKIIPFIKNWKLRSELNLLDILKDLSTTPQKEIEKTLDQIKNLGIKDFNVPQKRQEEAFRVLKALRDFLEESISINDINVPKRDLARIYHYMRTHNYYQLELDRPISLEGLSKIIDKSPLIDSVTQAHQNLKFALYHSNEGLIHKIIHKANKDFGAYSHLAQESLMRAISGFDPSKGYKFSTYAWPAISRAITKKEKDMRVSLYDTISEETKRLDLIEGKDISPKLKIEEEEFKEEIKNLLNNLNHREKEIIINRFGLNRKRQKTLEEIGEIMDLSKERIRQIESEALEKLRKNPRKEILLEHLKEQF